jgi:hypothetical protein
MTKYIVAWRNLETGETGTGTKSGSRHIAESWAAYGNAKFSHIVHWVEEVGEAEKSDGPGG